jgi:hypothetical protein
LLKKAKHLKEVQNENERDLERIRDDIKRLHLRGKKLQVEVRARRDDIFRTAHKVSQRDPTETVASVTQSGTPLFSSAAHRVMMSPAAPRHLLVTLV